MWLVYSQLMFINTSLHIWACVFLHMMNINYTMKIMFLKLFVVRCFYVESEFFNLNKQKIVGNQLGTTNVEEREAIQLITC